jgi:hypothetical protein
MPDTTDASLPDHNLSGVYEDLRQAVNAAGVAMNRLDGDRHHLAKENGRLRAALARYGDHLLDCEAIGNEMVDGGPCDCGWREATAALSAPSEVRDGD